MILKIEIRKSTAEESKLIFVDVNEDTRFVDTNKKVIKRYISDLIDEL